MRLLFLCLSIVLWGGWSGKGDAVELFPVCEKGYYGFVDQRGKIQIKPRFRQAGHFCGGLAAVQEGARYGYIDTRGEYVIEPQFDEASAFGERYAEVVAGGRKYLIDRQGQVQFEHPYRDWDWAGEERQALIVTTQSGRQGLINLQGDLILDTIYHQVRPFSEGLATVWRYDLSAPEGEDLQAGVVNLAGELIVPFGRFDQIDAFKNGYARVIQRRKKGGQERKTAGVINRDGELQFLLRDKFIDFIDGEQMYQEGLAEIAIYTVDRDTIDPERQSEVFVYRGVIDPEGKIVFSHPQVRDITPFENGRAFAKTTDHDWVIIDRTGKRVGADYYHSVPVTGFTDGTAVVGTENGLDLIDTEGRRLAPTADLQTTYYQRRDDVVFYEVEILEKDTYVRRWGFWDLRTGEVHPPSFTKIDTGGGFQNGLVQVEEDGRQGYVSRKGKYVWRAKG